MNDRYLFKAKRIDWQEWIKECQWFQGNLITIGERYYLAQCRNNSNELWIGEWVEIDTSTLCQCTGLKDMHGDLIWENDVVFVTDDDGNSGQVDTGIGEIGFLEGLWYISGRVQNSLYDIDKCFQIEIIGNIFDNPELLEVE